MVIISRFGSYCGSLRRKGEGEKTYLVFLSHSAYVPGVIKC
jgi:hypothetical protein